MKTHIVVGAILAVALSACGSQPKPPAELPPSTTVAQTTPILPPAVPAKGDKPPREFIIGKWGTDGDCTLAIDLKADGTSDGPFGNWTYNDGVIGFAEEPDFKVNVTVIDGNTMKSTNDSSDKTSMMTRCP